MSQDLAARLAPLANGYAKARGGSITKELGAGGSAAVFELLVGKARTALKVYDPSFFGEANGPAELRRVELQKTLIGHNCTDLIGILDLRTSDGTCFIEMEFVPWPTLKDVLANVPDDSVSCLISQLVDAVRFLDSKGIVHRDIKPENILVSPDFRQLKLIDLGVAREMQDYEDAIDATDHGGRRPFIATAQYSSPEYLFRLQAPSLLLWHALTIYQLGGVLHDLVMKRPLFQTATVTGNKFNLAAAVLREVPDFQGVAAPLLPLAALAAHCLVKNPQLRLKLVSYKSFDSGATSAAEKLRARMERATLAKRARSDLVQESRQHDVERKSALEAVALGTKSRLIELLSVNRFPIKVVTSSSSEVKLTITLDSLNAVTFFVQVEWDDVGNALVGEISLRAAMNQEELNPDQKSLPIGEIDAAAAGLGVLCETLVETICDVIVRAQDTIDVAGGGKVDSGDAI